MKINASSTMLCGEIKAVSSKSDAHRAVICAAMCEAETELYLEDPSDDINATADCLSAMGANIIKTPNGFVFKKPADSGSRAQLNCRESGSTLRFLLPVATALGGTKTFHGEGRLPSRPLLPLMNALESHNVAFDNKKLPLVSIGRLTGGEFKLPGNISSQFISGILMALPITEDGGSITVTTPMESSGYVDMTVRTMNKFGVKCKKESERSYIVPKGARYVSPRNYRVEGDWSGASFFLAAGAIAGDVSIHGLDTESAQADKEMLRIIRDFGADVSVNDGAVRVRAKGARPFSVDVSGCPDLFPILAVLACKARGVSKLYNAARLRLKESDRIASTAAMLTALGVQTEVTEDSLTVYGTGSVIGGAVNGANDHRIVMSAAIASLMCKRDKNGNGSIMITDGEAIKKSYPSFFRDFTALGGKHYAV